MVVPIRRAILSCLALTVGVLALLQVPAWAAAMTLTPDTATVTEGGTVTVDVLANDSVPGGVEGLSVVDYTDGWASVTGDNRIQFDSSGVAANEVAITYEVTDADFDSQQSTLTVTVDHPDTVTSGGPLTRVRTTADLNCDYQHQDDSTGAFYSDTACGTFAVIDGTLFGPADIPAWAGTEYASWTPVSQNRSGTGSSADPYKISTTVAAASTGVTVTQSDLYVVGQESVRTQVKIDNGGSARTVRLYRAADCYLADSDSGFGRVDAATSSVACTSGADGSARIEQFTPLSAGSHYYEASYSQLWEAISAQQMFDDSCRCNENIDNGAGLAWDVALAPNESATRASLITFSPTGTLPLTVTKTVDTDTATTGGTVRYTITVSNPGATAVSLTEIVDRLPEGFSYAGNTAGATTSAPSAQNGSLTWTLSGVSVPAASDVTLSFDATASSTVGSYPNEATATSPDVFVNGSGPTAHVSVTEAPQPPGPVTDLIATPGDGSVALSWTNPPEATAVKIFYQEGETAPGFGEGTEVTHSPALVDMVDVNGLTNGTTYTFAVFALNDDGTSTRESVSATPQSEAPVIEPVTDLQAAGAGAGRVVLTWVNPTELDGIVVRYAPTIEGCPTSPSDGTGFPVSGTPETVTVTGLTDGTDYCFAVFATLTEQVSPAATVEYTPGDCPALVEALDAPAGLVTRAAWVACSAPDAHTKGSTLPTTLPMSGSTQAVMTSGDVALAPVREDATDGDGRDNHSGSRGAYDVSIYQIDLDVPSGSRCLTLDYVFASEEFPEYVGQEYNDGFLAELDTNNWSVSGATIDAPNNFARVSDGNGGFDYASVNSALFTDGATVVTSPGNGTSYDGMSPAQRAQTPITPGNHSIFLSIFDAGDGILDSAAFIDRLVVSDAECGSGTFTPPQAADDSDVTNSGVAVSTSVLANDSDPSGGTISVTSNTQGDNGSVSCSATECTYTPGPGFTGEDSYTYTVTSSNGGVDTATVTITVNAVTANNPPDAVDDSASTPSGSAKQVSVLTNDTDPDNDTLNVTGKTNGANGTVTCTTTACTYTPTGNFRGQDSFTYTISDGNGGTDTATVTMTVTNRAPDAVNDNAGSVTIGANKQTSVLTNDTDPEGDNLSIISVTQPSSGSVTCNASTCTYTAGSSPGTYTYTYTVTDGRGGTDTATVTVTVTSASPASISIALSSTSLQWPAQVNVSGIVKSQSGAGVGGKAVALWAKPASGTWAKVAQTTSSGSGGVSLDHRPDRRTSYQWRMAGGIVSPLADATVTPRVTGSSTVGDLPFNRQLVVKGVASPVKPGAVIRLQRQVGTSWTTVASSTFGSGSTAVTGGAPFTIKEMMQATGTFTFRVLLPAQHGRAAATGAPFSVTVYRANVLSFKAKTPESITVKNIGTTSFDTAGWKLKNNAGKTATLPSRIVAPGATLTLLTGSGASSATTVYLGVGAMFRDAHDDIKLWDGPYLVLRHKY